MGRCGIEWEAVLVGKNRIEGGVRVKGEAVLRGQGWRYHGSDHEK